MSTALPAHLFAQLSDGQFHSGEALALALGVTRSAIWKAANALRDLGVDLQAVRNRGYRLAHASEPLDSERILAAIARTVRDKVKRIEVSWSLESSNSELLARADPQAGEFEALLAEFQCAGRGRRGRSWIAPPGGAICLSLSWTFAQMPRDPGALSLAIGVCVLRALRTQGVMGAQLKWPNDILLGDRKLGGILIELRAESAGPACVVVGIGLNVALGSSLLEAIATLGCPATDLISAGLESPSRNVLAAAVINMCVLGLIQFESEGLGPFVEEWRQADALHNKSITVHATGGGALGLARGIDLTGALLVETTYGLQRFYSGDVSVRPAM